MADQFNNILDRCLDRIESGESIEHVLADYPADSARLRPLLLTAVQTTRAYSFAPSVTARQAAQRRFATALDAQRETSRTALPWFRRPFALPAAIATVAVAIIIAIVGILPAISPVIPPGQQVLPVTPVTSNTGNFIFLISDEVNAIADFESVVVGINRIGLQRQSDGKWIEVRPEVPEVDLTTVPGDAVQEIWRGEIPGGEFRQVFVYVDNVTGVLTSTGTTTEIKLPGNKLHMSVPFEITDDTVTSFTYDMTVFATGNERNQKYMLKPQIGESGATQEPRPSKDRPNDQGQGNDRNTPPGRPTSLPTRADKPPRKEQ